MKIGSKKILSLLLASSILFLCACGGGAESETAGGGRTSFTEEELESGHASFQMEENLAVDADISPREDYEKSYATYYVKIFCETDEGESTEQFKKSPTLFRRTQEEWQEALEALEPGAFREQGFTLKNRQIHQKYKGDNGRTYRFQGDWGGMQKGLPYSSPFYCAWVWFKMKERPDMDVEYAIRQAVPMSGRNNDLSFLEDPEEQAGKFREFLEALTGRKVHERYNLVPVGKKNRELLVENGRESSAGGEHALFELYYDLDGLPIYDIGLNYRLDPDKEMDDLCYWADLGKGTLLPQSERVQNFRVDADGITEIDVTDFREAGDVCQKEAPVIGPNEVLAKIKDYYEGRILASPRLISDLSLVYTGYFSDGSEGIVKPVYLPVWDVTVYSMEEQGTVRYEFVYDAHTGEVLKEEKAWG